MNNVLVVNDKDEIIGNFEKEEAIEKALIRRISIVILHDKKGRILLQKRSQKKNSYPGCWANAAAGHVDEGESYAAAGGRELQEELGISNIKLEEIDKFFVSKEQDLYGQPKFVTVFLGKYGGEKMKLEKMEVEEARWFNISEIDKLVQVEPSKFTPIFVVVWKRSKNTLSSLSSS